GCSPTKGSSLPRSSPPRRRRSATTSRRAPALALPAPSKQSAAPTRTARSRTRRGTSGYFATLGEPEPALDDAVDDPHRIGGENDEADEDQGQQADDHAP